MTERRKVLYWNLNVKIWLCFWLVFSADAATWLVPITKIQPPHLILTLKGRSRGIIISLRFWYHTGMFMKMSLSYRVQARGGSEALHQADDKLALFLYKKYFNHKTERRQYLFCIFHPHKCTNESYSMVPEPGPAFPPLISCGFYVAKVCSK